MMIMISTGLDHDHDQQNALVRVVPAGLAKGAGGSEATPHEEKHRDTTENSENCEHMNNTENCENRRARLWTSRLLLRRVPHRSAR